MDEEQRFRKELLLKRIGYLMNLRISYMKYVLGLTIGVIASMIGITPRLVIEAMKPELFIAVMIVFALAIGITICIATYVFYRINI